MSRDSENTMILGVAAMLCLTKKMEQCRVIIKKVSLQGRHREFITLDQIGGNSNEQQ